MAKTSTNSIQNLNEDWSNDTNTGLPFSGEAVQTFIKSYLQNVTAAAWFNPTNYTMYFFANAEDRDSFASDTSQTTLPTFSCPMNFSSTLYRVNITNNSGSTVINTATNAGALTLSTTFMVQTKSITDAEWHDTQTGCYVTILIDRGLTGNYSAITERALYAAGSTISLDVFSFLAYGMNRVKFQFEAEDDSVTQSLVYTVNLAELYVELFNNTWYVPVLQSDSTTHYLGGFRIAGAGSKTLHLGFYNADGTRAIPDDLTYSIGTTNAYASTPFFYQIPANSPIFMLTSGVYTVKVFVATSALESEAVEYQVMFVSGADTATAKLVCINEVAERIYNYSSATICKYALYDGSASYTDISITFQKKDSGVVVDSDVSTFDNVTTRTEHTLTYEALWPGIEGTGYSIAFSITLGAASSGSEVPLDNSTVFPPTSGYGFYMLSANRNNGQTNRNKIVNIVDDSELTPTWTGVDFLNGVDGWTVDEEGRSCLRIPAKTRVVLPYTAFNLLSSDNRTFEICYKVANVANYDENVITLSANPTAAGFSGVRIRPNNITVHSKADIDASNDTQRGTNLCDDEVVHFVLTVNANYEGTNKIVKGYINGNKNFLFSYDNSTSWNGLNPNLTIGSDYSDVFVYFIRGYNVALSDGGVQNNYINSLQTVAEREDMNQKIASVLDAGGTNIDFAAVRDNGYNYFIVNMTQGNGIPSAANGWGNETTGYSTLEMHFGSHPHWDWRIEGVETTGQGTTSMNYYRWNVRWRIDKSNESKMVPVSYVTERTKVGNRYQYTWGPTTQSKTVQFDGTNHPEVMRITAKINQASSMQSHKMGATRAYTELHDAIGLRNEAQTIADNNHTPRPVVSVYEYPAFGFEYHNNQGEETYTFVGLFTIGPDKGDKPTFGYDAVKNSLISMEGTDHNQPLAKFAYPWNADVNFFYNKEGLAIDLGSESYLTGLEVGNCHGYDTDKVGGQDAVRNILAGSTNQFKDAYNLVWQNSTLIFAVTPSTYGQSSVANTLTYINNHLTGSTPAQNFRLTMYDDRLSYADMQFWINGDNTYTLYYYDEKQKKYVADMSLSSQNGTPSGSTANDKNEWFKTKRRQRFMANAANYFDLDDAIYHFVFCIIFGATDNFAKNSYPYKMATFANSGRWKWRQDDLDTIFDIDNSGRDSKPYQIEFSDSVGGTPYFAGSNSVFWNLINECYWDDYNNGAGSGIRTIGKNVINAMMRLSSANNPYEGFVNYIGDCFWGNAQEYFPVSAYNVDCVFKYEQAWLVNGQNVPPLSQALGNHYSGERLWVKRRAIYMLSLFRYGPFGDYSDTNLGTISFRPQSLTIGVTPLVWMYPALHVGQGLVVSGDRTQPGEARTISASADGNTTFYIPASNWLSSLGNLKSVMLGLQDIGDITITGAKLIEFLVGDTSGVTTNIPGIVFTNNKCLETIDARNATSVTSILGLENCTRLRSLLLAGSSVPSVTIAPGSKISTLTLPAATQSIKLRELKHITTFSVAGYSNVETVHIEDCSVDTFGILTTAATASSVLTYIRVLWMGIYNDNDLRAISVLQTLTAPRYKGLAADGNTVLDKPFIEGTIDVSSAGMTAEDFDSMQLDTAHAVPVSGTVQKAMSRLFNTALYLMYDASRIYITFADPEVLRVLLANNIGDGVGVSITAAAAVTSIGTIFRDNTVITSFNEFHYFTGVTTIAGGSFSGCENLEEVTFPNTATSMGSQVFVRAGLISFTFPASLQNNATAYAQIFNDCTKLVRIYGLERITLGNYCFSGASSMAEVHASSIAGFCTNTFLSSSSGTATPFYSSSAETRGLYVNNILVTNVVIPNNITSLSAYLFYKNNTITSVTATTPSSLTSIGAYAFAHCTALTSLTIPDGVTSIGNYAFYMTQINGSVEVPSSVTSMGNYVFGGVPLTNLTLNQSVNAISFASNTSMGWTGNGNGTLRINGNLTNANSNNQRLSFSHYIITGNVSFTANNTVMTSSSRIISFRAGGNITGNVTGGGILGASGAGANLEFIEVNGTISRAINAQYKPSHNYILHLGYNGIATDTPTNVDADLSYTTVIYVGPGTSQAGDQAVLNQYLAHSAWSAYSSKLATWWSYNGEYKNS